MSTEYDVDRRECMYMSAKVGQCSYMKAEVNLRQQMHLARFTSDLAVVTKQNKATYFGDHCRVTNSTDFLCFISADATTCAQSN